MARADAAKGLGKHFITYSALGMSAPDRSSDGKMQLAFNKGDSVESCDAEGGTFVSDELTLNYRKFGTSGATPILLLHGLLYFSYDWKEVATALAVDREVVALDQRGFGDSEWSAAKHYLVNDFAQDVVRLVEHRKWDKVVLVGHSMGGRVACRSAELLKQRAAGLVLLDAPPSNAATGARRIGDQVAGTPAYFNSVDEALKYFPATPWKSQVDDSRRRRFEAYLRSVPMGYAIKRDPYFTQLFFRLKASWPYHSYDAASWPWGQEFDMCHSLLSMHCPTSVVAGRAGDLFAPETVEKMEHLSRDHNSNVRVISHYVHHNIPGKAPEVVISEVANLLKLVEGNNGR